MKGEGFLGKGNTHDFSLLGLPSLELLEFDKELWSGGGEEISYDLSLL